MNSSKFSYASGLILVALLAVGTFLSMAQNESLEEAGIFSITSDQEPGNVNLGNSDPSGTGAFVISGSGSHIGITFTYSDLTGQAVGMHIHNAPADQNGGIVQTICGNGPNPKLIDSCPSGTDGTLAVVWNVPDNLIDELLDGNLYLNIHTSQNGGGEIRGQLVNGE